MRHSIFYRVIAKAQTIIMQRAMRLCRAPHKQSEDLHLLHYSEEQVLAERVLGTVIPLRANTSSRRLLIVIPFRDKWDMTDRCLEGLFAQNSEGLDILLALVDNGSVEEATRIGLEEARIEAEAKGFKFRHLRYDVPFNFSYLNNQAIKDCSDFTADIYALVNNDIEFIENQSLVEMVQACDLPRAGAIGCTLLYANRSVQHLFIFVGSKIVGSHPYKGKPVHLDSVWYQKPRAVGAVTGAVMFMKREVFDAAGGFDEQLPTSYQDVDLCLKIQKMGLVNWVMPRVFMIHHETQTRSHAPSWKEAEYIEKKWGDFLFKNPFVSAVWSRKSENFVLTPGACLRLLFQRNSQ